MNKKKFEILLITVLCTLIAIFTILNITKKPLPKEPLPIDKPPKNKETPFYEIKNELLGDSISRVLYINGISTDYHVSDPDFDEKKDIIQIDDIVVFSTPDCFYLFNKDALVIENVILNNNDKDNNFLYNLTKVVGKDIYYTSGVNDYFCNYLNKVYIYENKITYLGNQEFSSPETISTITGNDYKQEKQYICSLKEFNIKNARPIKKFEKLDLSDYQEHKVLLNNKEVTIKEVSDKGNYIDLEINGKPITTYFDLVYVTDQYILLMGGDPCGYYIGEYIDENGNVKDHVANAYSIVDNSLKLKNNQLTASLVMDCLCETGYYGDSKKCSPYKKAVLYYDGNHMIFS